MSISKLATKRFLMLICLTFCLTNGFAQQDPRAETTRLMNLLNKLEGTYQVQIIDSREQPTIPLSLMDQIEAKRKANSVEYIWLKSNVRVKILSTTEINAPDFKKLERVKYFSAANLN